MTDPADALFSPERRQARRFDTPYRSRPMTDQVFTEEELDGEERRLAFARFSETIRQFYPEPSKYRILFGELHGHSCLSDGGPTRTNTTGTSGKTRSSILLPSPTTITAGLDLRRSTDRRGKRSRRPRSAGTTPGPSRPSSATRSTATPITTISSSITGISRGRSSAKRSTGTSRRRS